ncbi:MAG TPA: DUF4394 domain-containing protein [Blastocatellia bacterium]|nr:DUF4394 domain-containing protein [Blastocatellia bacterium]
MTRSWHRVRTVGERSLELALGLFLVGLLFSALRSSESHASGATTSRVAETRTAAASAGALLPMQGTTCMITCPANVTVSTDPDVCTAVVNYAAPTTTGTCDTITCSPPSGSTFQVGTTTVNCFSAVCNTVYAVAGNALIFFDPATPGTVSTTIPITGLLMGESVVAIDFRPATGGLYGLGVAGTSARLLSIDRTTGAATAIGIAFTVNGSGFGFDFNPTNDRLRITSDADINLLVNPNDGTVTIQTNLNPGDPSVVGSAYSNNFAGATTTTLYAIDSGTDSLLTQVPATGTLTSIGSLGVDTSAVVGFDISACDTAYAALNTGGQTGFYTINVGSGAATLVGTIGGGVAVQGIAVLSPPSCAFTVTVNDNQPPSITCPTNVTTVSAVACPPTSSTVVTFTTPTATDNCPGVVTVCNPPSGGTLPVGTTTVTCTATDGSGNTAACSFSVSVFNGRLQDDSNPNNVLLFNTATGDYRLCCGGMVFTGRGLAVLKGCVFTLQHYPSDRRLLANVDFSQKRGTASLQFPPGVAKCTITDRNMADDTRTCP